MDAEQCDIKKASHTGTPNAELSDLKELEHHHAPVSQSDEAREASRASEASGWSYDSIFRRRDNTAFHEEALDKYGFDGAITEEQEKRLKRKLDWVILPTLGLVYAFYYIDKTTLSYAAIFDIKKPAPIGLGLHGTEYSWLSSAFYFGWLFCAIPNNLLMQKFNTAVWLGVMITLWGFGLMLQAVSKDFKDLLILRVFGGAVESIADPAMMLITTTFYTRAEQPSRISAWYAFNGVGVGLGGLLGFGIGHIQGALQSWKYEFLIIGGACTLFGSFIMLCLPSTPYNAMWLTREERLMAVARLRGNQTGIENRKFKWDQAKEAATDVKTWLFMFLGFVANIPNGGISNFSTLIIKGLGFNTFHTTLLGLPQGALVVIWIGLGAFLNSRLPPNSRTIVCMIFMIPTICGALGFLLAPKEAYVGRLICFYLTGSYQATFVLSLSLITSNTAGGTKKVIMSAIIWFGACIGNIVSPFLYITSQAPSYHLGIGSMLVANCLEVVTIFALRLVFIRENRRRDAKLAEFLGDGKSEAVPHVNETTFSDLTDKQNPNFRYVY